MFFKKNLKNKIEARYIAVLVSALALAIVMAVMMLVPIKVTSAYVETDAGVLENNFSLLTVPNTINEEFDNRVKKNVTVTNNSGNARAYVRAAVTANWVNGDGEIYAEKPVEGEDFEVTWTSEGWVLGKDGYYYYTSMLDPEEVTAVLLTDCKLKDNVVPPVGYNLRVDIMAQTIQAEGDEEATGKKPVILAWGSEKGGSVTDVDTDDIHKALIINSVEPYVYYRAHMTGYSDIGSESNWNALGKVDQNYHWLEGVQIQAVNDGVRINDVEYKVLTKKVEDMASAEVEWVPSNDGWTGGNGLAGTTGQVRPILGVIIRLNPNGTLAGKYGVEYSVLLKTIKRYDNYSCSGSEWTTEVRDGDLAGVDNYNADANGNVKVIGAIKVRLVKKN